MTEFLKRAVVENVICAVGEAEPEAWGWTLGSGAVGRHAGGWWTAGERGGEFCRFARISQSAKLAECFETIVFRER